MEKKSNEVHKRAMSLTQNTVSICLIEQQVKCKTSKTVQLSDEMPQKLAVGLPVHQTVRSKELISLLHGFGLSVDYNRILRVEAWIESSVLERISTSRHSGGEACRLCHRHRRLF